MPTMSRRLKNAVNLALFFGIALSALGQQKINPATQINWPASCTAATPLYNISTGVCVASTGQIVFTGPWSAFTTYGINEAVSFSGSQYVSIQNGNLNQDPATQTTYWALLFGGGSGMTQITGDIAAGPGTGSQVATLPNINGHVGTCGDATHVGQVTLNAKGQTTGCTPVSISSGTTLTTQTNGVNNASQTNLNLQNGTNTTASNPSAGNVQVNVPTATTSTLGVVKPDNTTITISGGVLTAIPSGNNVATVILAASNSPGLAHANIVCSGTNDEVCIQNALDTFCPANTTGQVNGCRVVLKNGVYKLSGTIHMKGNSVELEGEEPATWGGYRHSSDNGGGCIVGNPCGDIATGGAQLIAQSNYGDMIEWDSTPTPACGPTDSSRSCGLVVAHLYMVGFQYTNVAISNGGQADMSEIDDVMIQRFANCLNLNTDSAVATKIRCQDDGALGNFGGEHTKFRDGLIFDVNGLCGTFGNTTLTGNTFGDCGGIFDASPFEITGNDFYRIFCGSVWLRVEGFGGTITGNNFDNTNALCSSSATWIEADPDTGTGYGAFSISGNSAQTGNTFGQGGYFIDAGTDNGASVTGNSIYGGFKGGGSAYNVAATAVSAGNTPGFSGGAFYDNSHAYIIGDYVTYSADGRKYVCIANSTGNLPSNASFWTQLSTGTVPLAAWYKGETIVSGGTGTAITSWPDSSGWPNRQMTVGVGSTLFESSSTVDSLPGARFAGTSYLQAVETQFGGMLSQTIFVAVTPVSSSGGAHEALFSGGTLLTPIVAYDGFGNVLAKCCGGGGTFGPVSSGTQILEYNLTNPLRISTSGTLTSLTGSTNFAGGWSQSMWMGATNYDNTGAEFFFSGDIADVMVFNGSMSNADAAIVGAALCAKYGVTCSTNW